MLESASHLTVDAILKYYHNCLQISTCFNVLFLSRLLCRAMLFCVVWYGMVWCGVMLLSSALEVINRIQAKLTGRDFVDTEEEDLTVEEQVELLIEEATSVENLCQLFTGWCPLW